MTNPMKKITKKDYFNALKDFIDTCDFMNEEISKEEMMTFLTKEIETLDKKSADAKARAEKNKAAGDELRNKIFDILVEEDFMTTPEIQKALEDEDLSSQKITARLTQLVNMGTVEKEEVKREDKDGKTIKKVGYRKIGDVTEQ